MAEHKPYNQLGKEIFDALSEGLSTGDLSKLNNTVSNSVDAVLEDVENKLNQAGAVRTNGPTKNMSSHNPDYTVGSVTRARQEQLRREHEARAKADAARRATRDAVRVQRMNQSNAVRPAVRPSALPYPYRDVGSVSSVLHTVFGSLGLGSSAVGLTFMAIGGVALVGIAAGGLAAAGCAGMIATGVAVGKRRKRAVRYNQIIAGKKYISINELAAAVNEKPQRVLRDLKKMLKKGYFPQGHIDEQETTLILTDDVYRQYIATAKNAKNINESKDVIDTTAREVKDESELEQMIREGNEYIAKLHAYNDQIPGETISNKMDETESLLREIFKCVKEHPEQMPRMHELMEYYLPTMIKLVEAYAEYDKVSVKGSNITSAMQDIENTLDTINEAFEKLLNNLFRDSVWDVTTDAQVLKNMLYQKGLANSMKENETIEDAEFDELDPKIVQ